MARKQIGVLEDDVEVYAWSNVAVAKGLKPAAKLRKKIKKNWPLSRSQKVRNDHKKS